MSKQTVKVLRYCIMLCLFGMQQVYAQNIEIIDASQAPFTPESLIRNYFIGDGIDIINISYEGINEATGYFSNGIADLGLDQGIILSTGKVTRFSNSYMNESSTLTSNDEVQNQELANIIGADNLKDIATYEITFIPTADSIQFNYVFASEEYPEYVCSEFNDVFGFFINGPDPSGGQYNSQNIAIVLGTNLPVSINNVNGGTVGISGNQAACAENANLNYSQYYRENKSEHLIFDGILTPFIAAAQVIPCETYTIRFSIGDVSDFIKDSAVFLEGKSFSSNSIEIQALTTNANGTITEGCASASIIFELPVHSNQDELIHFKILGTAENGIDYDSIPNNITIPAGQISSSIDITPLADELNEEIESIGIVIANDNCFSDTIWVGIEDNYLISPEEQDVIYLCDNLADEVDFTVPFTTPSPTIFRNQNEIRIEPTFEPVYSPIEVQGIYPSSLNKTDFIQVCIDELTHPWIDDLSIYLYGPDNQFLELTSKNGGNGGNGTQPDFLINTCFTFDATDLISDPNHLPPFSGQFQPEGDWADFFGSNGYRTNGIWRLMMIDDYQGSTGILRSWSIHFGKSYDIQYSWSPSTGISCTDCPNPSFDPITSQTYTLNIDDTNGCNLSYEVEVIADEKTIPSPEIMCGYIDMESISFNWEEVPSALSYAIRINGMDWVDIGLDLTYTINELNPDVDLTIEIEAIGACGSSEISSATCTTSSCSVELEVESLLEPSCDLPNGGNLALYATAGVPPYTFTLGDEENSTGIFENLSSGEYVVFVTDAQNCTSELAIQIEGKDEILIQGIISDIECGEETGSIDLTVSGGTGLLDFSWSDNYTGDAAALPSGVYSLLVTDENGCTAEAEFTINSVANFEVEFEISHPKCINDNTGVINIRVNDPGLSLDFLWSTGDVGSRIQDLDPGIYDVVITNTDGCQLTQSIALVNSISMETDIEVMNNFCFGDNQGFIDITISGGNTPYDIKWSNNKEGKHLEDLMAGIYLATISDANGCEMLESIELTEPEALSIADVAIVPPNCSLDSASVSINPIGGTGPYMARLNNGIFEEKMHFSNLNPGEYHIEIMDDYGCTYQSEEIIHIEEIEELELITESNIKISLGESTSLFALVTNRNDEVEYVWEGNDLDLLSCAHCPNPIFTGLNSTSYEVTAVDKEGCHSTENVVIFVNNNADIFVPNVFSPNGDGVNDRLAVFAKSSLVSSIDNFTIYDRWGNQVFGSGVMEINNEAHGWDGQYKGKPLNQGFFVWSLKVTFIDGTSKNYSGDVTLIR